MIDRLLRTLFTIRHMKPTQLAFFLIRRKLPAARVVAPATVVSHSDIALMPPIAVEGGCISTTQFEYLNQVHDFGERIDWSCAQLPRLWGYNLHYFDYLRNSSLPNEDKLALIDDWIASNPQGKQPGWEPFTASLRIVSWIFFFSRLNTKLNNSTLQSLYQQVLWLEKNDERHILANHYFENLKALLFAGVFFKGKDADRWLARAQRELAMQLSEQMLDDGGHFERSPQYHALMLENCLDIVNLVDSNPTRFDEQFRTQVREVCLRALSFLRDILFPDQQIPLFNDSAFGIAPEFQDLSSYAASLGLELPVKAQGPEIINKSASGLYGVRLNNDMLIMDCGEVGPAYQPGHTHCDLLSYELMSDGQRVIVDSGVMEYAPGETRHFQRSTAAHNTVTVGGLDQSEVWGEFRVARRAKVKSASVTSDGEMVNIEGAYHGFFPSRWQRGPGFSHSRKINVKLLKERIHSIIVIDRLGSIKKGSRNPEIRSYIHFHPDISLSKRSDREVWLNLQGDVLAVLELKQPDFLRFDLQIKSSSYSPEFGLAINNQSIVISAQGELPGELIYSLMFK